MTTKLTKEAIVCLLISKSLTNKRLLKNVQYIFNQIFANGQWNVDKSVIFEYFRYALNDLCKTDGNDFLKVYEEIECKSKRPLGMLILGITEEQSKNIVWRSEQYFDVMIKLFVEYFRYSTIKWDYTNQLGLGKAMIFSNIQGIEPIGHERFDAKLNYWKKEEAAESELIKNFNN